MLIDILRFSVLNILNVKRDSGEKRKDVRKAKLELDKYLVVHCPVAN